jgi:hypothetical protein
VIRRAPIEDLRRAVEALPAATRVAMLAGIRDHEIIVGAYSDRVGGMCPMLAAHRCGGRTDAIAFARAWDRFCAIKAPRPATPRELLVLEGLLEASLLSEHAPAPGEPGAAAVHPLHEDALGAGVDQPAAAEDDRDMAGRTVEEHQVARL